MIYLDNSATTYPKPKKVQNAMMNSMINFGANPGRSGHKMSMNAGNEVLNTRKAVQKFFNAEKPENVVFTLNCTLAINMILKGILKAGDHVVISALEHNAVMRPLNKLTHLGIKYTVAQVFPNDNDRTVESFRMAINAKTALICCNHASNVWGIKLPVGRIAALAKIYNIPILVDAAQSAGLVPIDVQKMGIDYLCTAGHKGLYGPMGTGILIAGNVDKISTIIEGGTGTNSMLLCQPEKMPQKFESGTPNTSGICALKSAIEFVNFRKIENIFDHEIRLITYLYEELKKIKNIILYAPRPNPEHFVPVLSFNIKGKISDVVGTILDSYGIEVRTGLHCAPMAHKFYGTEKIGAVRVSPSVFTTKNEIDKLIYVLKKYCI